MAINRKSILVQSATASTMNVTTAAVEGDSYYGYSDGLHTLAVKYNGFKGRLYVQGIEGYNIVGNFAWLRLKFDRSYLGDGTTYSADYGQIDSVRLSA